MDDPTASPAAQTSPQPDLGNLTPAIVGMLTRIVVPAIAAWLATHSAGLIGNSQAAQMAADLVAGAVTVAAIAWGRLVVLFHARQAVAAAVTGNPHADPSTPAVQAQVVAAIKDPGLPCIKPAV